MTDLQILPLPINSSYWKGTSDTGLSGAQFLGGLGTGLVKNTTSTGVLSIATAGTDYQAPISLTTTGSSGAATFSSNTLNIPQYQASGNYITGLTGDGTASGPGSAAFTLATSGVSAGTYNYGNGSVTFDAKGRATAATSASAWSQASATRTIQTSTGAVGWQLSSSRWSTARYGVTASSTATIGGNSTSMIVEEIAPTNSATPSDWVECARVSSGQVISLAVILQSAQTVGGTLDCDVPPGYYVKVRSTCSGTCSATYNSGQEVFKIII